MRIALELLTILVYFIGSVIVGVGLVLGTIFLWACVGDALEERND